MPLPNDDIPSQIIPLILWKMSDTLNYELFESVPEESPTSAGLIKIGLMQENPSDYSTVVSMISGDYEDDGYIDAHLDHPDVQEYKIRNLPRSEVGGGTYWWRRFSMRMNVFFVKQNYDEDIAIQHAYEFYGRLLKATEKCQIGPLTDSFGEKAHGKPFLESASYYPSGGKGKWIFRGQVHFRVLTWRP